MSREIRAQALLLESLVTQRPIPGMDQILTVPDNLAGDDSGQMILVDSRNPSELDFPPRVTIMTRDELESYSPADPVRILEFQPPEHFPGKISVRLRLSVASPGRGVVPDGEIIATFEDRDPLTAVEPTHVLAY